MQCEVLALAFLFYLSRICKRLGTLLNSVGPSASKCLVIRQPQQRAESEFIVAVNYRERGRTGPVYQDAMEKLCTIHVIEISLQYPITHGWKTADNFSAWYWSS